LNWVLTSTLTNCEKNESKKELKKMEVTGKKKKQGVIRGKGGKKGTEKR